MEEQACREKSGGQVENQMERLNGVVGRLDESLSSLRSSISPVIHQAELCEEAKSPEDKEEELCVLATELRNQVDKLVEYEQIMDMLTRGVQL